MPENDQLPLTPPDAPPVAEAPPPAEAAAPAQPQAPVSPPAITDPKQVPGIKSPQQGALNADEDAAYKLLQEEARKQAAALANQIGSGPAAPVRPHDLRQGDEEMVACIVPKTFQLTRDDRFTKVEFLQGIRQIPKSLLNHWWVKANGVKPQPE